MPEIKSISSLPELEPAAVVAADLIRNEVYGALSRSFTTAERFLESRRRFGSEFYVMESDESVIAAAVANHCHFGNASMLQDIAVHPDYRGHGNGRSMVAHVAHRALLLGRDVLRFMPNVRTDDLSVPFFSSITGVNCQAGVEQFIDIETILNKESV